MVRQRQVLFALLMTGVLSLAGCQAGSSGDAVREASRLNPDGTPTATALLEAGPLGDRTMGRADAPVTIVEYASLTCPHCRAFHQKTFKQVKKAYIDTGKARYILREFPIGRQAAAAAVVTRCAPADKFFILTEKFLAQQRSWVSQEVRHDPIFKIAAQTGMTRATFDKCVANQAIIDGLVWVKQRGREFGVSGTPTFFINGKKTRGALTFEQVKAMIELKSS